MMENLIGKEVYCTKVGPFRIEFILEHGTPKGVVFPTVGHIYNIRGVYQYEDTPDYISVTLVQIVNPKHGGNPFSEDGGVEFHFPLHWFADIDSISIEAMIEEITVEPA